MKNLNKISFFAILNIALLLTNSAFAQWTNSGLSGSLIKRVVKHNNNLFASSGTFATKGAYLSVDTGRVWTSANSGLTNLNVSSFASKGSKLFASTGGVLGGSGVFVSINNGTNWTSVDSGLTDLNVTSLVINDSNIFAGTTTGGVFLSTNDGGIWKAVNTGLTNLYIKAMLISGSNILVSTSSSSGIGAVYISSNNGNSWSLANSGLPTGTAYVQSFALQGTTIYAGTNGGGAYISTNNGTSWSSINKGLSNLYVTSFAITGNRIYAGTYGGGVFLSTNNGSSWTQKSSGLTANSLNINALAIFGNSLFAATNDGILKSSTLPSSGISEINNMQFDVKLYPNPNNGKFVLRLASMSDKIYKIDIYNVFGTIVFSENMVLNTSTDINISDLQKGIYFVQISDETNCVSQKIIFQ